MADETTTSYADLLLEMAGVLQENFPKYSVLLDELRRDTNRKNFSGSWVRVPLILNPLQGGHGISETGTVNTPAVLNTTQAHILMARNIHPISFSPDLMYTSKDDRTSFAEASRLKMKEAEEALGRMENEQVHGLGTGQLAKVSTASSTTTVTLTTATFNSYNLYVNRVVDIGLAASPYTLETAGSSRTISAVTTDGTNQVVLDAAVTVTTSDAIFVHGSAGQGMQGIQQIYATSGTFQNISKTTVTGWQGTDGRAGDTTSVDLSISLLDGAERRVKANGAAPDFYVGDPAVIDKFGQTLLTQSRWEGDKGQLDSGWEGVRYRSKLLIPDFDHLPATVTGINKASLQMYGYNQGPEWDDLDGSILKRIGTRALPVEAWLVDYAQLGANRCNLTVFVKNLNQAS